MNLNLTVAIAHLRNTILNDAPSLPRKPQTLTDNPAVILNDHKDQIVIIDPFHTAEFALN